LYCIKVNCSVPPQNRFCGFSVNALASYKTVCQEWRIFILPRDNAVYYGSDVEGLPWACNGCPTRSGVAPILKSRMMYQLLADFVLLLHFVFVAFALFGGLLVLRYPKMLWLHLPALLWGMVVQLADLICPLTPLENWLRYFGGEEGYAVGFVEHYVGKVLYPENLAVELRYVLGAVLAGVNVAVYFLVWWRKRR
jgi:hypothetical protein